METIGNIILITGGGSGIGRALAEAFHKLGNQGIISGRTQKTLDAATAANPGMKAFTVDMTEAGSIRSFAAKPSDPRAMPLEEFITEVMEITKTQPDAAEINVRKAHPLRYAAEGGPGKYEQVFTGLNDAMSKDPHRGVG